jgi:hypothetical protein
MKLVDSKIIAQAEVAFYNGLSSSLDLAVIGKLFRRHYNMRLSGPAHFQDLKVEVHNSQIAFKFEYTALGYFSIFMDRSGEFLKMEATGDQEAIKHEDYDASDSLVKADIIRDRATRLAESIAGAIEKETLARLIEINSHAKLNGRLDFMGAQFVVHENEPVYNLIYQGEVALSFLVDNRGRFLDFADITETNDDDMEENSELLIQKFKDLEEIIIDEERGLIIDEEPNDDTEVELIDGEELLGLDDIIVDDPDDFHRNNSASN